MQTIEGRIKKASLTEGDPEKNPHGTIDVTISCFATESNVMATQRLRGMKLVVMAEQEEMFEGKD